MVRSVLGRWSIFSSALAATMLIASCATQRMVQVPVIERSTAPPPRPVEIAPPLPPVEAATAIPVEGRGGEKRSPYYMVEKGDTLYSIAQKVGRELKDIVSWNNLEPPFALRVGQVLAVGPPEGEGSATPIPVNQSTIAASGPSRSPGPPPPANTKLLKIEPLGLKRPYSEANLAELASAPLPVIPPVAVVPGTAAVPGSVLKPPEVNRIDMPKVAGDPDDANIGWIWPAAGKVIEGFGDAKNKGIDIAGKAGDPVVAAGDGKVVYVGNALRDYGNLVIVKHNGNFLSVYGHNRSISVKDQQAVRKGEKIAEMGSDADQVKLHFEIRNQGKPVDPLKFLPAR